MGRPKKDDLASQVKGCQLAIHIVGDALRLSCTPSDQLNIAATFLARALAPFDADVDVSRMPEPGTTRVMSPRSAAALRQLEAAGRAIGAELRRRQLADAFLSAASGD